jgi:hypothetical protein
MEMVNDAQLDLESLKGDVKTSEPAFSQPDSLFRLFESMEKYLGNVVKAPLLSWRFLLRCTDSS